MMTLDEARRIALDKAERHANVTFDLAATILQRNGEPALRQLAEIKVALQRGYTIVALDIGN